MVWSLEWFDDLHGLVVGMICCFGVLESLVVWMVSLFFLLVVRMV